VTKHWLAGALIACVLILIDGRAGTGADSKATRVAYPSAAASFIPLWAANDARFFKKENLAVELVAIRSSPIAMTALLSGEIDAVVGGANPSISMQLHGYKDVAIFGGLFNLDSAVETQWDMRTKIALTIQLLIHGDFNCAAVETGESRKMSRCSTPQPTITFSATESFHNQLRNPGSGQREQLFS